MYNVCLLVVGALRGGGGATPRDGSAARREAAAARRASGAHTQAAGAGEPRHVAASLHAVHCTTHLP